MEFEMTIYLTSTALTCLNLEITSVFSDAWYHALLLMHVYMYIFVKWVTNIYIQ
jgi:hypothetical protein